MERKWDEPEACSSERGWFYIGKLVYGYYLDYGPEHYRSQHEYCRTICTCRLSQPGNILAVRFRRYAHDEFAYTFGNESRYFKTVAEAKAWVEQVTPAGVLV